jgi:hypothetical protein
MHNTGSHGSQAFQSLCATQFAFQIALFGRVRCYHQDGWILISKGRQKVPSDLELDGALLGANGTIRQSGFPLKFDRDMDTFFLSRKLRFDGLLSFANKAFQLVNGAVGIHRVGAGDAWLIRVQ